MRSTVNDQTRTVVERILQQFANIELEVGSGKGLFLCQAASAQPDTYFLGVELAKKYAEMAQAKVHKLGLANAQVLCADGVSVVADVFPDASVNSVHVYFPDPWWKARHKKRRVLNERMLKGIERILKPSGQFHFWTDVLDYYDSTLQLIASVTQLSGPQLVEEKLPEHDLDYRTHFERRTRLNSLPVYRSIFQKAAYTIGAC